VSHDVEDRDKGVEDFVRDGDRNIGRGLS